MKHCGVIAFAGHMIDDTNRSASRFPPAAEPAVRARIRAAIQMLRPSAAISSAACGGDIIFAEEALHYNTSLYVILPFANRADFIQHSVAYAGAHWIERFHYVCDHATVTPYTVKPGCYRHDQDFEDNQRALIFFALGMAAAHDLRPVGLILCDMLQLGSQIGGTRSFLEMCRDLHIAYEIIDIATLR